MKRIGITGGIATGKSTVTAYLRDSGFIVIDADEGARKVVDPKTKGLQQVINEFGSSLLTKEGTLDRQQLATLIFNDTTKRQQLNEILHPLIFQWIEEEAKKYQEQILFIDMPLMFEVDYQNRVDLAWLVDASPKVQLERLMIRNQLSEKEARNRISAQWSMDKKRALADVIINNDDGLESLYQQIDVALEQVFYQ